MNIVEKMWGNLSLNKNYKATLKIVSLFMCLPIMLITLIIILIIHFPLTDSYVTQHDSKVTQSVSYVNRQILILEHLVNNIGVKIINSHRIVKLNDITQVDDINKISSDLLLIENSNALIQKAEVAVISNASFVIGSGGTHGLYDRDLMSEYRDSNTESFKWKLSDTADQLVMEYDISPATDGEKMLLTVAIDINELFNFLNASSTNDAVTAICVDGVLIADREIDTGLKEIFLSAVNSEECFKKMVSGINYSFVSVVYKRIDSLWTFYSAVPINSIIMPLERIVQFIFILSLVVFFISAALSQYLAKQQYLPFKRVMADIFVTNEWEKGNELEYLKNHWFEISMECSHLSQQVDQSLRFGKHFIMNQLIEGYYDYMEETGLRELLHKNGIDLSQGKYCLMKIQLSEVFDEELYQFNISNSHILLEEIVRKMGVQMFEESFVIEYKVSSVLIFVQTENEFDIKAVSDRLFDEINQVFGCYITIGFSVFETNISQISDMYKKINSSIALRTLVPENQMVRTCEINTERSLSPYPRHIEKRLLVGIQNMNVEELKAGITDFIDAVTSKSQSLFVVQSAVGHLYDNLEYFLTENKIPSTKYFSKNTIEARLLQLLSKEKICDFLLNGFLVPIGILLQESQSNNIVNIAREVTDYIQTNYADAMLSLESCANRYEMDPTYLSKVFKKATGKTFIDYLTDVRLYKAKELLLNSRIMVNQVAEEVGYQGNYFNRVFKKRFHMSPGQYREQSVEEV